LPLFVEIVPCEKNNRAQLRGWLRWRGGAGGGARGVVFGRVTATGAGGDSQRVRLVFHPNSCTRLVSGKTRNVLALQSTAGSQRRTPVS
jgi:hypothetical protein